MRYQNDVLKICVAQPVWYIRILFILRLDSGRSHDVSATSHHLGGRKYTQEFMLANCTVNGRVPLLIGFFSIFCFMISLYLM
jgi:hypothetical protein